MAVIERYEDASVMGQGSPEDVEMEDLMRCKEIVESARRETLRNAVGTARKLFRRTTALSA